MWELKNHTPFSAETGFYRSHEDAAFWGLWIAADFALRADKLPLFVPRQDPIAASPVFDETERLVRDAEKTPPCQKIDLIAVASAMQPPAQDRRPRRLGLRIGAWHKELDLYPPLKWGRSGQPRLDDTRAPVSVPMDGSASFGGREHPENPIGHGHLLDESTPVRPPATLYPAGQRPSRAGSADNAGMFGPISPMAPVRTALAGTYDVGWQSTRAPLLPTDFNPAFWQSAPVDQRLPGPLPAGAILEAYGFDGTGTPANPTRFPLPSLTFRCDTRIGADWHGAQAEPQAILVNLKDGTVRMTFHARWQLRKAADDVLMSRTVVSLADTSGFRVAPTDVDLFQSGARTSPERSGP